MMSPTNSSGTDHFNFHDGLEERRLRHLHAFFEAHRSGDLERHIGGIDLVVGAVVHGGPEVRRRVSRKDAMDPLPRRCPFPPTGYNSWGSIRPRSCRRTRSPRREAAARTRASSRRTGLCRPIASCTCPGPSSAPLSSPYTAPSARAARHRRRTSSSSSPRGPLYVSAPCRR